MKKIGSLSMLFLSACFLAGVFWPGQASASTEHNVRGRAYTELYGLISFNCLDDDFAGTFPFVFPFVFHVGPCELSDHGVNIDFDNNFSGEAWNPILGYIEFEGTATPDNYAFNTHCQNQCDASNNCTACYNDSDQRVYGWGRVVSSGIWIELNSLLAPQTSISNYLSPSPGYFSGYASSSIGAISFDCHDDDSCGTNDYQVYMWKVEVKSISAPNWSYSEACSGGARKSVFKWVKRAGIQSAYRIVANTVNSTSTPLYDSGKIVGNATQYICPGPLCAFTPNYNTPYYWWLMLWDEDDVAQPFVQFDTREGHVITDNVLGNTAANPDDPYYTFTAYKHEFPDTLFDWDPHDILIGSSTQFTSNSSYYSSALPNTPQICNDGVCDYLWTCSAFAEIDNPNASSTAMRFYDLNPKTVTLTVTDADNYMCSTSSPLLEINFDLPIWKEVKAE